MLRRLYTTPQPTSTHPHIDGKPGVQESQISCLWSLKSSTEFVSIDWPCHLEGTFPPTQLLSSPKTQSGQLLWSEPPFHMTTRQFRKSAEGKGVGLGLRGQGPLSEYSLSLSQCPPLWSPAIHSCVTAESSRHFGFHGHQRPQETLTCTLHTFSLGNPYPPPQQRALWEVFFSRIGTVGEGSGM